MQETPASKRITLIEKEGYVVDLEYGRANGVDFAILHLPTVAKFTKTIYQDMKITIQEIWQFLSAIHYDSMFVAVWPEDPTINKFVCKLGFVFLGEALGRNVYQYKEYK